MNFRVADTFTDSLARLTGDEQKLAKSTAFDFQLDPVNPDLREVQVTITYTVGPQQRTYQLRTFISAFS